MIHRSSYMGSCPPKTKPNCLLTKVSCVALTMSAWLGIHWAYHDDMLVCWSMTQSLAGLCWFHQVAGCAVDVFRSSLARPSASASPHLQCPTHRQSGMSPLTSLATCLSYHPHAGQMDWSWVITEKHNVENHVQSYQVLPIFHQSQYQPLSTTIINYVAI